MISDFSRIITLLRKEKGVTQKQAASELGISQALLSHYEKGIRECGLDFVVRVADYYGVSCDYLLGRSPDRSGLTLSVEELPGPEGARDGVYRGILPTFSKKLIQNSLNILYDKLSSCKHRALVRETSNYLMLAVYKMFRLLYAAGPKNASSMFSIRQSLYSGYTNAAMDVAEANVRSILAGEDPGRDEPPLKDTSSFAMTTESLSRDYPLYSSSLLNLIKSSENLAQRP